MGSSSLEEEPENLVLAADDEWVINEADMEMIRIHKRMRKVKYEPKDGQVPIPLEYLDNQRKTIMEFSKGKKVTKEDNWRSPERPTSPSTESWKGRTVFKILRGGIESRTSVRANLREPGRLEIGSPDDMVSRGKPEDSSGKPGATGSFPLGKEPAKGRIRSKGRGPQGPAAGPAVPPPAPADDLDLQDYEPSEPKESDLDPPKAPEFSSLEPRRIALPLPGQEVSRASPQYQRMLEKLNNDVELYKLHVKLYHMSSAQFRRRTSMLGLPGRDL